MGLVLVLGGTRSGKSETAERIAAAAGAPVVYVATGTASDAEMGERIAAHRARRPSSWTTVETADPAAAVADAGAATVLVDSLGGWLAALMLAAGLLTDAPVAALGPAGERRRAALLDRVRALASAAAARPGLTVVVAEEAGLGPVAPGAATRRYLDLAGEAAQLLAARAERAVLVVAGRTLELGTATPPDASADPAGAPLAGAAAADPARVTRLDGEIVALSGPLRPDAVAIPAALRVHGDALVPPGAEDFAVNVERGPRPAWLDDALAVALATSAAYPDESRAVEAVARRHGRSPEEVVVVNGAAEAFWLLAAAAAPGARRLPPPVLHRARGRPARPRPSGGAVLLRRPRLVARPRRRARGRRPRRARQPDEPHRAPSTRPTAWRRSPGRGARSWSTRRSWTSCRTSPRAWPGATTCRASWSCAPSRSSGAWPGVRAGYVLAPADVAAELRRLRPAWNANAVALAAVEACAARRARGARGGRARAPCP